MRTCMIVPRAFFVLFFPANKAPNRNSIVTYGVASMWIDKLKNAPTDWDTG